MCRIRPCAGNTSRHLSAENDMMREMRQGLDRMGRARIVKVMGYTLHLSALRHLAIRLAVVLPLLALGLFPAGIMPGQDHAGRIALVLCSGDGPMLMVLDPATGTFQKAPPSAPKAACDWAMAQAHGTTTPVLTLPLPPLTESRASFALASLDFRPTHDPRGIYARGPPSLI